MVDDDNDDDERARLRRLWRGHGGAVRTNMHADAGATPLMMPTTSWSDNVPQQWRRRRQQHNFEYNIDQYEAWPSHDGRKTRRPPANFPDDANDDHGTAQSPAPPQWRNGARPKPWRANYNNRGHDDDDWLSDVPRTLADEEDAVLRECLHLVQTGVSGQRLRLLLRQQPGGNDGNNSNAVLVVQTPAIVTATTTDVDGAGGRYQPVVPPSWCCTSKLGASAAAALQFCATRAWYQQRIQHFIDTTTHQQNNSNGGGGSSIARALASAVRTELQRYQQWVASAEVAQVTTLRQLCVCLQTATVAVNLATLALVVDSFDGVDVDGPAMLTALYMHSWHGDTRHAQLVQSLHVAAAAPWWQQLYEWTMRGRLLLANNHTDFIIAATGSRGSKNLWHDGYLLDRTKVPDGLFTDHNDHQDWIGMAFEAGKGINFIRQCLGDHEWQLLPIDDEMVTTDDAANDDGDVPPDFSFVAHIEARQQQRQAKHTAPEMAPTMAQRFCAMLTPTSVRISAHILTSLRNEHHLMRHLFALQQFLLLGQGDFFGTLLDALYEEYYHYDGIVGIHRHTLSALVDGAIKATNARDLPADILARLSVELRLLAAAANDNNNRLRAAPHNADKMRNHYDASSSIGTTAATTTTADQRTTVWDIITLEYIVPDPIRAIVHEQAYSVYQELFLFLFELRKVDFMLNVTWRQSAVLQHALQMAAQYNALHVKTHPGYAAATTLLRQISMTRQTMMHFVTKYQSYIMFEVLQGAWSELEHDLTAAATLNDLIAAHDAYLDSMTRKCLLREQTKAGAASTLSQQLGELLRLALKFASYQDQLFAEALEAADRAAEKRREAEHRLKQGMWGFETDEEMIEEDTFFGLIDIGKLNKASSISRNFNRAMVRLLKALDEKLHGAPVLGAATAPSHLSSDEGASFEEGDLESLRFLAFQLDHNDYYARQTAKTT